MAGGGATSLNREKQVVSITLSPNQWVGRCFHLPPASSSLTLAFFKMASPSPGPHLFQIQKDIKQQALSLERRREKVLVHFHLLSSKEDGSLAGIHCASHYFDADIGHSGLHMRGDKLTSPCSRGEDGLRGIWVFLGNKWVCLVILGELHPRLNWSQSGQRVRASPM